MRRQRKLGRAHEEEEEGRRGKYIRQDTSMTRQTGHVLTNGSGSSTQPTWSLVEWTPGWPKRGKGAKIETISEVFCQIIWNTLYESLLTINGL
jgi:hypothetical protein